MSYASILEIVGIKELAEDDFGQFASKTDNFKVTAEQCMAGTLSILENTSLQIFIFRDHCYIQCDNIDSLLAYINNLRLNFFKSTNYFFRCVLTVGDLNIQNVKQRPAKNTAKDSKGHIVFTESSEVSIRLHAMMERFKGVGIMVDIEKLERDKSWPLLKTATFTNFYISDVTTKKYQSYTDIAILANDELYNFTKEIFERMYYDKMYSKKLARFYVPLLINMAKNYDITAIDSESEYSMGKIIGKSIVSRNKDVIGFEFFFYMLIEKIFDANYNKSLKAAGYEDKIMEIEKNLVKNIWLLELLRNDSKFSDIPKEILSDSKRRIVLRRITGKIQELEKNGGSQKLKGESL